MIFWLILGSYSCYEHLICGLAKVLQLWSKYINYTYIECVNWVLKNWFCSYAIAVHKRSLAIVFPLNNYGWYCTWFTSASINYYMYSYRKFMQLTIEPYATIPLEVPCVLLSANHPGHHLPSSPSYMLIINFTFKLWDKICDGRPGYKLRLSKMQV